MKIRWNNEGFHDVRTSTPVRSWVDSTAASLASAAGAGYSWDSRLGARRPQGRWRAIVFPDTWAARRDNARSNTLVRVLGGGSR